MENLLPFRPAPLPCPSVTALKEDWKSGMSKHDSLLGSFESVLTLMAISIHPR